MVKRNISIMLILLLLILGTANIDGGIVETLFYVPTSLQTDSCISGHVISDVSVNTELDCAFLCSTQSSCKSFSVVTISGYKSCCTKSVSYSDSGITMTKKQGCKHYEKVNTFRAKYFDIGRRGLGFCFRNIFFLN